jgi:hypothetical protein
MYSQTYDRLYNPSYMWTTFEENFSGSNLDPSVWEPTTHFKRALGFLIDSAITNKRSTELMPKAQPPSFDRRSIEHTPKFQVSINNISQGFTPSEALYVVIQIFPEFFYIFLYFNVPL